MSPALLVLCAVTCAAVAIHDFVSLPRVERSATRAGRLAELLAALGRRMGLPVPAAANLRARLAAAGVSQRVTVEDVLAVKGGGAVAALLLAMPVAGSAPGRLGALVVIAAPAAGLLAPDFWLARRARDRQAVMLAQLPETMDLLRVALAAGLSLPAALQAVGRHHRGPLAAELSAAADAIGLGAGRDAAMQRLGERCPLPAILAFVAAVRRSESYGTPIAAALAAIATDARADRARRLQDHAARAAPKIQLVVALLLVPAAMLLLAAGMVAGF